MPKQVRHDMYFLTFKRWNFEKILNISALKFLKVVSLQLIITKRTFT